MSANVIATMEALRRREDVPMEQENAAIDAVIALVKAARPFNQLLGGESIPDSMTTHRVDVPAMDFYRLQEALKGVGDIA